MRDQLGVRLRRGADRPAHRADTRRRRSLPMRSYISRRLYVDKTHVVSYGPHGRANVADIWRRRDLPRDGKAPVLVHVPGGAWVLGGADRTAYPLLSHLVSRGWVCVSLNYRVVLYTPGPITSSMSNAHWHGSRRTSRRYGGDPPSSRSAVGRPGVTCPRWPPDTGRPAVPAGLRRRRHLGGRRGPGVRAL